MDIQGSWMVSGYGRRWPVAIRAGPRLPICADRRVIERVTSALQTARLVSHRCSRTGVSPDSAVPRPRSAIVHLYGMYRAARSRERARTHAAEQAPDCGPPHVANRPNHRKASGMTRYMTSKWPTNGEPRIPRCGCRTPPQADRSLVAGEVCVLTVAGTR